MQVLVDLVALILASYLAVTGLVADQITAWLGVEPVVVINETTIVAPDSSGTTTYYNHQ